MQLGLGMEERVSLLGGKSHLKYEPNPFEHSSWWIETCHYYEITFEEHWMSKDSGIITASPMLHCSTKKEAFHLNQMHLTW